MPSNIGPRHYAQAVLDHVQTGVYPESEDIISAELPASALPAVFDLVKQAQDGLKEEIRRRSREVAPDINGWISQARQLRLDIRKSEDEAQAIVDTAQHGKSLGYGTSDTEDKVSLLEDEITFNHSLERTLQRLQTIRLQLDGIQQAILGNKLADAVRLSNEVGARIGEATEMPRTRVTEVLSARGVDLRQHIADRLIRQWNCAILVDPAIPSITIKQKIGTITDQAKSPSEIPLLDLESTTLAMRELGTLEQAVKALRKDIETRFVNARLSIRGEGLVEPFEIEDNVIFRADASTDLSAQALFTDLKSLIQFLSEKLPDTIVVPLAEQLMPSLVNQLTATWLGSAVPEDLEGVEGFKNTLALTQEFGTFLQTLHWPGQSALNAWMESIPELWLRKRQELSLGEIRNVMSKNFNSTEVVEREETQILAQNDKVFAHTNTNDDWNADWSDEEDTLPINASHAVGGGGIAVEEDVSAWGLDDEETTTDEAPKTGPENEGDDGTDAWGWGEENEQDSPVRTKAPPASRAKPKAAITNGLPSARHSAERELTLRETYTITSLPKEILEIIHRVTSDVKILESPVYAELTIAKSATSLLSIPRLALTMYRASAPSTYASHASGKMFIYNDCLWLAEQIQNGIGKVPTLPSNQTPDRLFDNFELGPQISALQSYGKRAYGKEMESQRTIITDLLDGAQGFMHCTEHPFNRECDIAIASVVDRLRQLHQEWKSVLSQSALLQSLGSLLSTLCSKYIVCVEDMPDISEPESQRLVKYTNSVIALKDLFAPHKSNESPAPDSDQVISLTALYVPEWLRFQYLAEILESSLADIKFLWIESELSLYYETEELVDLIVALFADSPHRRSGIGEIRSAGKSRR